MREGRRASGVAKRSSLLTDCCAAAVKSRVLQKEAQRCSSSGNKTCPRSFLWRALAIVAGVGGRRKASRWTVLRETNTQRRSALEIWLALAPRTYATASAQSSIKRAVRCGPQKFGFRRRKKTARLPGRDGPSSERCA